MTFPTEDKIIIDELDFDNETRLNDEDFNEIYQKFCIHIIDNDGKTADKLQQQILSEHEIVERLKNWLDDIPKGDARIIDVRSSNEACSKRQMEEMKLEHQKVIARQEVKNELKAIVERK